MYRREQALHYRRKYRGLISIDSKPAEIDSRLLSILYTPGVAQPCQAIAEAPVRSLTHSGRGNTVAVVSDGSSTLGLGDVGPEAALPILESKAVFFKKMAGLDAFPLCLNTREPEAIVDTVKRVETTVGAVSLEDISSPRCFEIEQRLQQALDIPVLHNDQHGTAITALSILHNVCRLQEDRRLEDLSVVVVGAGAAGMATVKLLHEAGLRDLTLCDRGGIIHPGRRGELDPGKRWVMSYLRSEGEGDLADAVKGRDVFVGLSAPNILTPEMVRTMNRDPVIIAGAAPDPEIEPEKALEAGASVVCTARFDYPNMVTDALALPGLFRGVVETGARTFTTRMMLEAARTIARSVPDEDLRPGFILPELLDLEVGPAVAGAVAGCALEENVARRIDVGPREVQARTRQYVYEGDPVQSDPSFWENLHDPVEQHLGLAYYRNHRGPLTLRSKIALKDRDILGLVYIPGLGEVVKAIREDPERVYELSCRGNLVAVATNGSAVLGLGDIGVPAGLPVMEGKSVIFKTFAGVEAFPLCVEDGQDPDVFVETVKRLEPCLGGVNLEDIAAPDCFEIERRLKGETDIPIFHDDQHGTAVVTLAALSGALTHRGWRLPECRIVINGAGASALATARILREAGATSITLCDSRGIIHGDREGLNAEKRRVSEWTNPDHREGKLEDALVDAHVFIGLSIGDVVDRKDVQLMQPDPIVFALANPTPEISPPEAREGGASVVATGRSDYPNQVNNAIAFPGVFRGALDVRATEITPSMKVAAADALSELVRREGIRKNYIIPRAMDFRTAPLVAEAVARQALEEGVARREIDPETIRENTKDFIYEGRLYYLS